MTYTEEKGIWGFCYSPQGSPDLRVWDKVTLRFGQIGSMKKQRQLWISWSRNEMLGGSRRPIQWFSKWSFSPLTGQFSSTSASVRNLHVQQRQIWLQEEQQNPLSSPNVNPQEPNLIMFTPPSEQYQARGASGIQDEPKKQRSTLCRNAWLINLHKGYSITQSHSLPGILLF